MTTDNGTPVPVLGMPPQVYLTPDQARRITCLGLVLDLVAGRSVPIQVVERIAAWAYNGARES
jgi:hypothetical protein